MLKVRTCGREEGFLGRHSILFPDSMAARVALRLDRFAARQWESTYTGTRMVGVSKARVQLSAQTRVHLMEGPQEDFEARMQEVSAQGVVLAPGYAPFCK